MNLHTTHSQDMQANLVHQAQVNAPDFSEALHQRIMANLPNRTGPSVTTRQLHRPTWRIVTACAASLALVVGLGLWLHSTSHRVEFVARGPAPVQSGGKTQVVSAPSLVPFESAMSRVAGPSAEQLAQAQFGYLDRDARDASRFMLKQLDILPASLVVIRQ